MSRRAWRVMLVVVLAGVIALAGAQLWRLDRDRGHAQAAAQEFETVGERVSRGVLVVRASERAYVATGQGYGFWQPSVDRTLQQIREDLSTLKATASVDISPKLDAVLSALTDVTRLEKRIVDHAAAGRLPHASDLIFADGLQASLALERTTDDLVSTHRTALAAQLSQTRWQELGLVGLIAGAGLLVSLLLLPLPAEAASDAPAESTDEAAAKKAAAVTKEPDADRTGPIHASSLGLASAAGSRSASESGGQSSSTQTGRVVRPGSRTGTSSGAASDGRARTGTWRPTSASEGSGAPHAGPHASSSSTGSHRQVAAAATDPEPQPRSTLGLGSVSQAASSSSSTSEDSASASTRTNGYTSSLSALSSAASLCSALARASDAHALDSLLPQMAEQLDAVGLIVWLRDDEGHALKAALSHGYPRQTLAALPAIDPDAENATARAARLAQPQVVASAGTTPGALVVPMMTAAGCVGVVSIELPPGREHDEATSALARIFAAQLAMLTA